MIDKPPPQDLKQKRFKLAILTKAIHRFQKRHKRFLHQILGRGMLIDLLACKRNQPFLKAINELAPSVGVSTANQRQEVLVGFRNQSAYPSVSAFTSYVLRLAVLALATVLTASHKNRG